MMKKMILASLGATLMLAQVAQAAPAAGCPAAAFPAFFPKFADSAAVQKAFTDYPLAHVLLDHAAKPGPREIKVQVTKAKLAFPLIPPAQERKRAKLALRIDEAGATSARATLLNEDKGYQMVYIFRKDACWKLERIEDRSL
jgi:hypothetical protein